MGNHYECITNHEARKISMLLQSILIGLLTGLLVVLYRLILHQAEETALKVFWWFGNNPHLIAVLFAGLILAGLLLSHLVKKNPMISGSGIPQVKGQLLGIVSQNWLVTLIYKFIGGAMAILGGLSLGREGPSIQLGACLAEGIGEKTGKSRMERKILMASGASAGLAAAFNAPLAGVVFALEEVFKYFSPLILLSTMGAAVTADMVSKNVFGLQPVFNFQIYHMIGLSDYWLTLPLGIALGIFGAIYNGGLLKLQSLYRNASFLSDGNRIVVPFLFAGAAGLFYPYILGSGHHMMSLLNPGSSIGFLSLLLVLKFLFSIISFASGAPGGIFFPLLILGAAVGAIVANFSILHLGLPEEIFYNILILAMAGCFSAIVRAPITGIVLIMEMTGSLSHMLSLTIVSMVAFIVADLLGSEPIYDSLLDLLAMENDQEDMEEHTHKIIVELLVRHDSIFEDQPVCDIPWPDKTLLVSVKRGAKEMIPRGDTVIKTGDYLFILTDVNSEWKNRESLDRMNGLA